MTAASAGIAADRPLTTNMATDRNDKKAFLQNVKVVTEKRAPLYNSPEYKLGIISFKCDIWSLGIILYLLLHGYYPHDEASYNINYKFNIPLQVRDIINNMLIINYKFRYSIDDILNHEWINS